MKVYTVIPIVKSLGKNILTYFGKDNINPGALVSIPLRKKNVLALVIKTEAVDKLKSTLRSSAFSLKKLGNTKAKSFLDKSFLNAVQKTARWHAVNDGQVLSSVLPKIMLDEIKTVCNQELPQIKTNNHEKLLIQSDDEERFAHYKSFIRGEFAKKHSVFFCVPTSDDAEKAKDLLEKGIEQFTFLLLSGMGKKDFRKALKEIRNNRHPLLIISTIPFLSISRGDIGTIIVERENSKSYRTQKRPYLDLKKFAENLSKERGLKYIAGDILLSVETIHRKNNDEFVEFAPLKFRSLSSASSKLVDMKDLEKEGDSFRVLSDELLKTIDKTLDQSDRLFIFGARKGLAPTTVCGDCGQVVTCRNCQAPITLYGKDSNRKSNVFICNRCGNVESTDKKCTNCSSWKLKTLGIGTDRIEEVLKKKYPKLNLFVLDKDHAPTTKKAHEIAKEFMETPGGILIGTEMALFYLNKPLEHVAVASIDSLLSIPDFRMNEKTLYLLIKMRLLSEKSFLIQTRNAKVEIFEYAMRGNLVDFYKDELALREKFNYPPFKVFVKLTVEGTPVATQRLMDKIEEDFNEYSIDVFESAYLNKRGRVTMHGVIRVDQENWPNDKLLKKISGLPPQVSVKVDPESIL